MRMKMLRSRSGASASALPPSSRLARSFTSVPVAPTILSPALLKTASLHTAVLSPVVWESALKG